MINNKILIVDDEEHVLHLLNIELATEGYVVEKAGTAKEAINKAQQLKPNLILMDIMLPDMSGADAVRNLKKNPSTKDIPVLFLTALLTKSEEQEDQMINVDDHRYHSIAKPFEPKELLAKINSLLGND